MNSMPFSALGKPHLEALAKALEGGHLAAPFGVAQVRRYVPDDSAADVSVALRALRDRHLEPKAIAWGLRLLAAEHETRQDLHDRVELVWTGPDQAGSTLRDTLIVVRELLRSAEESVVLTSYVLDKGPTTRELLSALSERMEIRPTLRVRLYVNVSRPYGNEESDAVLLRRFADDFKQDIWPGRRLPEVYYDPRALDRTPGPRACLHAKCVIVDDRQLFVTSANFTDAAHNRNIEAGVLLDDAHAARTMTLQLESLVLTEELKAVPGLT